MLAECVIEGADCCTYSSLILIEIMTSVFLQDNLDPLPPVTSRCLRADVRVPASQSPRCDQYDSAGNLTTAFAYPPSTYNGAGDG